MFIYGPCTFNKVKKMTIFQPSPASKNNVHRGSQSATRFNISLNKSYPKEISLNINVLWNFKGRVKCIDLPRVLLWNCGDSDLDDFCMRGSAALAFIFVETKRGADSLKDCLLWQSLWLLVFTVSEH